jgi:hypothetical protein
VAAAGLTATTGLTLLVIPVVYTLLAALRDAHDHLETLVLDADRPLD